jgi:hypothetical protein
MPIELIQSFLEHATAHGARSTVLTDLRWFIGLILSAILIGVWEKMPAWLVGVLVTFLAIGVVLYFAAYIWFGIRNPDSLRSEKFSLTKMAIEKSAVGPELAAGSPAKTLGNDG